MLICSLGETTWDRPEELKTDAQREADVIIIIIIKEIIYIYIFFF